jgi:PUA domain protein
MSQKGRRYLIKSKEAKIILDQVSSRLKMNGEGLFGSKSQTEIIESERVRIFLVNGKPLLFENENVVLPTLFFSEALRRLPKIIVDMGAVPYVCKGADVMAPGIVRIEGEFRSGQLLVVADVKYGKLLSLGESLVDSTNAKAMKQGPVVKNLHYVSDKVWQLLKNSGDS